MDTENWIALAGIAVTLITSITSSLLPTWYKNRVEQAKARQPIGEPQQEIESKKILLKTPYSIYFGSSVAIIASVVFLIMEIYKPDPITRRTIFSMTYYSGTIVYHMLFLIFIPETFRVNRIMKLIDTMAMIHKKHEEQIQRILGTLEAQQGTNKKDIDEA